MSSPSTDRIRNVAIVGHGGSGKTTLAEALLLPGRGRRQGRAGRGRHDGLRHRARGGQARRCRLSLAIAPFEWTCDGGETYKVNVVDTPGYADFAGDVDAALDVADLAVLVVSAVEGVEVADRGGVAPRCAARGLPRLVFVNKEDKRARRLPARVLDRAAARFGAGSSPLELPIGEEADLPRRRRRAHRSGLRVRARRHATTPTAARRRRRRGAPPPRRSSIEEIVAGDDEQLERYLAGDAPIVAELERTLAHEVLDGSEFPVLLGSATTGVGVDRLADFLCELGPSPADRPATVHRRRRRRRRGRRADSVRQAAGPRVQDRSPTRSSASSRCSRCCRARSRADDRLVEHAAPAARSASTGCSPCAGKEQSPVTEVVAGDLAAVAKLTGHRTGDTLAPKGTPVRVAATGAAERRSTAVAIGPAPRPTTTSCRGALARLQAEDPALVVDRDEETHQTVLRGTGDTHLAVALERLARKFGVNVDTEDVRVPYRETIAGTAEAEGKVKKQSGGHGQFAVANLRVAPAGRGDGLRVRRQDRRRSHPRAVHPRRAEGRRGDDGHRRRARLPRRRRPRRVLRRQVPLRRLLRDGFRTAAVARLQARPWPRPAPPCWSRSRVLTVTVPERPPGRRARRPQLPTRPGAAGTTALGNGEHRIVALVPTAELQRYAVDLRSMTGGRGTLHRRPRPLRPAAEPPRRQDQEGPVQRRVAH